LLVFTKTTQTTNDLTFYVPLIPLFLNYFTHCTQHGHQRGVIITQQGDQFPGGLPDPLFVFCLLFHLEDVRCQQFTDRDILCLENVAEVTKLSGTSELCQFLIRA
jgi:hypothetical protein